MPAPRPAKKSAKKVTPLEQAKEEIAHKQIQIDELSLEVAALKENVAKQDAEVERLRGKLNIIIPEILSHRDRDKFPLEPVTDPIDIDAEYIREMVYMLVDDLYLRQNKKSMIEQRIEELETRVTEQSLNYQTIVRKNLACMNGIEEALESTNMYEMTQALKRLKQDLLLEKPLKQKPKDIAIFNLEQRSVEPSHALEILKAMESSPFTLPKPIRKQSGDTHIRYLLPEIKEAICNELGLEKTTRGDWRCFAQRVGVATETVQFWRRLNIKNPMEQVLTYWRDSDGATVRMLHRHLMSPQLKAVILAKIVADFYHVD